MGTTRQPKDLFMRRTILSVLAVCLTAVALPLVADAAKPPKPPGKPGPGGADLTIAAKPNTTVFRGPTVISGKLNAPAQKASI